MRHQLSLDLCQGAPQARPGSACVAPQAPARGSLLILSCSATKDPGFTCGHFRDLYTGPMWLQVKASGFPLDRVAAISALYGFMEPDYPAILQPYDSKMDDESAARIAGTSDHLARLARCVLAHGSAYVVGGELYRRIAQQAERIRPAIAGRLIYATGTYLEQRKQLGEWLRAELHTQGV